MNFEIPFGKYKMRTIREVSNTDSRYLIWLYKQPWIGKDFLQTLSSVIDELELTFGRHKGETLQMVKEKDPKYYKWLLFGVGEKSIEQEVPH